MALCLCCGIEKDCLCREVDEQYDDNEDKPGGKNGGYGKDIGIFIRSIYEYW